MLRLLIVVPLLLVASPHRASAQEATLSLAEVYRLAGERNPMVKAAHASAEAVAARQSSAALPPDPQLQLGAMNLSLPGVRADMPGAMLPSVQAMQMIPFPGKLRLSGELARQSSALSRTTADETWWEIRARAALAFHEIHRLDRQLEVMRETFDWLEQVERVATSMYSVGTGRQSDVLRAGVELARTRAEIARMQAMRGTAAARLNAVLDRPASTPVPAVGLAPLPGHLPSAEQLRLWAEESRPLLERGRLGVEQALTREQLAARELWPDLSIGVQYGQRPGDMGTARMGSLMLGFTLPVYAGQRQLQMRREAAAMTRMADAELAATRSEIDARLEEILAELERARTLLTLYRTEVLPQAEGNVASALAAYRVGRVDFLTLVDARLMLNEYRQELHALSAEYGSLIAELEMTIGRELPPTPAMLEIGS
jgi:outer membrane protein, heavy metal efflux system